MKLHSTRPITRLIPTTDVLIGLALFAAGLFTYTGTLAPTVLEGDAALFQYTPYVLGITYPTGYPLYLLLGKLWLTLLPVGEIAWRMNLFSAVCAALALPLIFGAARRLYAPGESPATGRLAAIAATLILATLPTFWRWSTEAKIYALNMLLFSGVLYTLATAATRYRPADAPAKRLPLALPVLLFGLQIAVHSTTVLLMPGLLLFAWCNCRRYLFTVKNFAAHVLLLALPGLLYLYVPLRAEWLIAHYTRPEAIARGLLANFYTSGLPGLVRYFTAADFTGGVVTNWGQVPGQFFSVYVPLLLSDFTTIGVGLGLAGGLALAVAQPRRFAPLLLLYATPIPFVLTYGQGEQSAFLLPSFLALAVFAGYSLVPAVSLTRLLLRRAPADRQKIFGQLMAISLVLLLIPAQLLPQIQQNWLWLSRKWTRAMYTEWADALNHPLEPGAGMLAHWGDLTSFWYMQHAEGRRPDLRGVYPPTEAVVRDWFERNPNLYIAGPLQGWAAGIEDRYQLIPWGRLVRIAPRRQNPASLLPTLAQPVDVTFDQRLRLIGADFAPQAAAGQDFPVTLTWQALAELGPDTTVSLRLATDAGTIAQIDDRLRSGWFPRDTLPAGQYLLSYPLLPVPVGVLPGQYRLQLVVYQTARQPWPASTGAVTLDLGPVEVGPPPAGYQLNPAEFTFPASHDFNNEIRLAGYAYSVNRVGQGKGFALRLLWQALRPPADNYTLLVEQLDAAGNVLRVTTAQPESGRAPTAAWQPGQFVRDQVDLVVPAGAPPGDAALQLRLSWQRPNGTLLNVRRWGLPLANGLYLEPLRVIAKADRNFTMPAVAHPLDINFENKTRLAGYTPQSPLEFTQTDCAAGRCALRLEFYWQGLAEMEQPYQIFLHVVSPAGKIVAQADAAPGARGKQPTTGWLPGEVVTHPVEITLPADIATGSYRLITGMYLPPNRRLPVQNQSTDAAEVGVITVRPR